jgi:thiol-disulfide isomerase/thioredoxin
MVINFRGIDTAKVKILNPPYVYIQGGPKNELLNLSNYMDYLEYQTGISYSQKVYSQAELSADAKQKLFMDLYAGNDKNSRAFNRYLIEHNSHLTSCLALLPQINFEKDSSFVMGVLSNIKKNNPSDTLADAYLKKLRITQEKKKRMEIGQVAPDFSIADENGKMVSPKDFAGKVLVIDFWASWCGPCRAEIPKLKEIYADYKDRDDVAFLSISIDSKKEDWIKALGEENMEWHQLWATDSGKELMDKYQFNGIPFIVAIDKDGKLCGKHLRGDAVRQAIVDALK